MHYRGKSFKFTARYPDGGEEILLNVPRYDFNWQNVYLLRAAEAAARGHGRRHGGALTTTRRTTR